MARTGRNVERNGFGVHGKFKNHSLTRRTLVCVELHPSSWLHYNINITPLEKRRMQGSCVAVLSAGYFGVGLAQFQ